MQLRSIALRPGQRRRPNPTPADATGLFDRLASPIERYVAIGNGAHLVSAERNAWQVFDEVIGFLKAD